MSTPKLKGICPIWLVDNIDKTCAFYEEKLGFEVVFTSGYPPDFATVAREGATISFSKASKDGLRNHVGKIGGEDDYADAYIWIEGVRELFEQLGATEGVTVESTLKRYGSGMVDFIVTDLNGYKICFGEPADKVPNSDDLEEDWR